MRIKIWGKYRGKTERIDEADSWKDARYLVGEYQLAYGKEWLFWAGRKKDGEGAKDSDLLLRRDSDLLRVHQYLHLRRGL